jgi:hypothetical protein
VTHGRHLVATRSHLIANRGVPAKDTAPGTSGLNGPYRAGPSKDSLKVKNPRHPAMLLKEFFS